MDDLYQSRSTTLQCNSTINENPMLWTEATDIKASIERLKTVNEHDLQPLDEVKEQLNINPRCHKDFISHGGGQALCNLLKEDNSVIQRKCMQALEGLAMNDSVRNYFREAAIVDILLDLIRNTSNRPHSRRREKAGDIIKLIAGNMHSRRLFDDAKDRDKNKDEGTLVDATSKAYASGMFKMDGYRERPLPLWYHTINPILPWDSEAVTCLVDMLMTSDTMNYSHDCIYRIIRKIINMSQFTRHIILDKRDIADLVTIIGSTQSSANLAMKAVTFVSIMHPSNDITFVRTGGIESLITALRLDSIGNISGEMAAWTIYYFASSSRDTTKKFLEKGVAEALVEMLNSPDYCAREAAVKTCVTLLKGDNKNKLAHEKFKEANAIPALLSVLQDRQYHQRQQLIFINAIKSLLILSKIEYYRQEILAACALETLREGMEGYSRDVQEAARNLEKILNSKSLKIKMSWKHTESNNLRKKSIGRRIAQKMKKIFKVDTRPLRHLSLNNLEQTYTIRQEVVPPPAFFPSRTLKTPLSKSYSSITSSENTMGNGLLTSAPGRNLFEVHHRSFSKPQNFHAYTMQPYCSTQVIVDHTFDPYVYGGRTLEVTRNRAKEVIFTLSDGSITGTESKSNSSDLITTHDFI